MREIELRATIFVVTTIEMLSRESRYGRFDKCFLLLPYRVEGGIVGTALLGSRIGQVG